MKVRINEKRVSNEQLRAIIRKECESTVYSQLEEVALHAVRSTVAEMIYATMDRRGLGEKYIRQRFEEIVALYETPPVLGREMTDGQIIDYISKKYGLDFDRLKPKFKGWSDAL